MQTLEQRIASGLARIGLVLRHQAWELGSPHGLTPTQGQILAALSPSKEGLRLNQVAMELGVTPPTASEAVATLERRQLLERLRDPADRRAIRIVLTSEGRKIARELRDWPDVMREVVATLPPEDQAALLRIIIHMIKDFQLRGLIPPARMCVNCMHFRPHVHETGPPHHCALANIAMQAADLRIDSHEHLPAPDAHQELVSRAMGLPVRS